MKPTYEQLLRLWEVHENPYLHISAFQKVADEIRESLKPKKPREWWLNTPVGDGLPIAFESKSDASENLRATLHEVIHVREVLPDPPDLVTMNWCKYHKELAGEHGETYECKFITMKEVRGE